MYMTDNTEREDFELWWSENGYRLLREDSEYRRVADGYKMSTGADWLLFGIPVVAAVVVMEQAPIEREMLRWVAGAAVAVVCFVACVWIKSLIAGGRPVSEIERDVKERHYGLWLKRRDGEGGKL